MAKKSKVQLRQERAEMMALVMQICREKNEVPSLRNWQRNQFIDFGKVVEVLTGGDKPRALAMIGEEWNKISSPVKQKSEPEENLPTAEVLLEAPVTEESLAAEAVADNRVSGKPKRRYRQHSGYLPEDLVDILLRIQAECRNNKGVPSQKQIVEYVDAHDLAPYACFIQVFGPKTSWPKAADKISAARSAEVQKAWRRYFAEVG